MRATIATAIIAMVLVAGGLHGCRAPLSGAPCPCLPGYECNEQLGICQESSFTPESDGGGGAADAGFGGDAGYVADGGHDPDATGGEDAGGFPDSGATPDAGDTPDGSAADDASLL